LLQDRDKNSASSKKGIKVRLQLGIGRGFAKIISVEIGTQKGTPNKTCTMARKHIITILYWASNSKHN
tara:strand:- start:11763 stop:11966 length:204 start_codon:yes stop_codon:yes gene_type:complete